ncbi:hypothetical protein [Mesorhizobium sp. Root552]|uniref:hypothetical protein n=1 Tax=Mesorhizobium sp. Root552 TaxID=1736555 RepID=UPI0012E95264|nr:hypothetical protein [Mesorhizobium sp. Root552]
MLTLNTFESFRVYSLDTIARLGEALELVDEVKRGRIPPATLTPIYNELAWSFSKDEAAKLLAADEIEALLLILRQPNSVRMGDFASRIKLIQKLVVPRYKERLEELILKVFGDPKRRTELRKLVGFYCSHIINLGYQRRFIFELVQSYFFAHPIQRARSATLSKFFREFDGRAKKFVVHAAVTRDLAQYLKGLGFTVRDMSFLTADQAASLSSNTNAAGLSMALECISEQFDPHGAMTEVFQMLSSQRAIAYLDPHGMRSEWGETMHVARARAKSGSTVTRGDFLVNISPRKVPSSGNRLRSIRNYARSIATRFDEPSTERLLSSINTAALARTSVNPENQLISFWSAIEVLLSEPRDDPRIVHYASLIVPCIALRHTRRQVTAVYDELLVTYRSRFRRLVWETGSSKTLPAAKAFAELMFLPEYAPLRTKLCGVLAESPLALHRVWKLHRDYRDVKCVHRTITDHFNRVNWQINRIYRARNQLVHAGRMPSYLESLILNLAEYYRSSVSTIISRARVEDELSDIDQIVAEIGIRYEIMRTKLSHRPANDAQITPDDVAMIMDH